MLKSQQAITKQDNPSKNKACFVLFTVCFLILACLVFLAFILNNRSFIWASDTQDGLAQHCNALAYYGTYLRHLLSQIFIDHHFSLKMFDLSIGFGSDIIATLHYYCIGDPLALLSVFFPTSLTEYLYDGLVILRLYLAGLAFIAFALSKNKHYKGVLLGSLIYVFCGFALFSIKHPYFLNTMIALPLMCLGIDRSIERRNPWLLSVISALALLTNFYFYYMLTFFALLYAFLSFFAQREHGLKRFFYTFFKTAWYYAIGAGMGMVIFLPVLNLFLSTARSTQSAYVPLLYSFNYYARLVMSFASMHTPGSWTKLSYMPLGILCIIAMFIKGKQTRILKIAFVMMTVMICIPWFGHLLNGLSYVSNRWTFAYSLLVGYIVATLYPELPSLFQEHKYLMLGITGAYCLVSLFFASKNDWYEYVAIIFIIVLVIAYLLPLSKVRYGIVLICVISSLAINANMYYSPNYRGYSKEFLQNGQFNNRMVTNATTSLIPETQTSRYDTSHTYQYTYNSCLNTSRASVSSFYSLLPGQTFQFYKKLQVLNAFGSLIDGLNDRTALEELNSVRYYIASNVTANKVPYGFLYNRTLSQNGTVYRVYENRYALPLGYTYASTIPASKYNALTPIEKQEALLQGAVVSQGSLKQTSLVFQSKTLPSSYDDGYVETNGVYENDKDIKISGNTIYATRDHATCMIRYQGHDASETYLSFKNLSYQQLTRKQKDKLGNEGYYVNAPRVPDSEIENVSISVTCNDASHSTIVHRTKYDSYYSGINDYLVNLGYREHAGSKVRLTFNKAGVYHFDQSAIIAQPMKAYASQVNALKKESLEDVHIDDNVITGHVTTTSRKLLVFSIPAIAGWKLYVDGKSSELVDVNETFMGTYLASGTHKIQLVYETPGLKAGALISLTSSLLLLISLGIRHKYHEAIKI